MPAKETPPILTTGHVFEALEEEDRWVNLSPEEQEEGRRSFESSRDEELATAEEIGRTADGRPVMSHPAHPLHEGFTEADHLRAMSLHMQRANQLNRWLKSLSAPYFDPQEALERTKNRNGGGLDPLTLAGPMYFHVLQAGRHRHCAEKAKAGTPLPLDTFWPAIAHEVRGCRLMEPEADSDTDG